MPVEFPQVGMPAGNGSGWSAENDSRLVIQPAKRVLFSGVLMSDLDTRDYEYLGYQSEHEYYSVYLWCDHCKIAWDGCAANSVCICCGDGSAWEEQMRLKEELDKKLGKGTDTQDAW